jgi:DNA primase
MGNQYQTVCHGGHKHKLYYYHDSKSFHCYTDCSENMDIFEVVVRAKGVSFPQAVQYVAAITGKTFGFSSILNNSTDIVNDWDIINRYKKKEKIMTVLPEYDSKVMDVFLPYPHESWINDGISIKTMNEFEIGYYIREEKITIVHRDINSRFIGLRGRAMKEEDIDNGRKYMPLSIGNQLYNHMTMMNLYGLHKTKDAVKKLKKIMFFEGEKSILKCQDYYGDLNFTCAVCSSNISNFHRDIAVSLGVEEVFIAFDKFRAKEDSESEELYQKRFFDYQEKLIKYAQKFTPYCRVYILWDTDNLLDHKDSPADKGKEVLEELMKNKFEINTINEVEE